MNAPATMGDTIRIRVRLFAIQRELAGTRELALDLPAGASVDDAWQGLVARHPALAPGRPFVRFAVDGSYVEPDATLRDGSELACIPPVSGGGRNRVIEIRDTAFSAGILAELAERLATDEDGGIAAFLGRTRITPGSPAPGQEPVPPGLADEPVEALDYEAHESMVMAVLESIADEIAARFGVERVAIVHRTGRVPLGEASVAVVAAAPHRDAAFRAARYAIDEAKARAPIWKAERFRHGHVWIGEPARGQPNEVEDDQA